MNIKNLFVWTSVIVGIIALIVVGMLVFNSKSSYCHTGDKFDNATQMCYFQNVTCPITTQASPIPQDPAMNQTEEQQFNCLYAPTSLLDNKIFLYTLIAIGVGWIVIFIFFLVDVAKRSGAKLDVGEFRPEDRVDADRARRLWAATFAKDNNIPMNGEEHYQKSVFNFFQKQQIFQKGEEWFVQFQCEVLAGKNPGLYTAIISLSRGEKWILGGNQNWEECNYKAYKLDATRPLHTPKNTQERMLQQLAESNPERAIEIQSKMIEEGAARPAQQEYVAPDVVQPYPAGMPPPSYRPRRPWYRRRY